MSAAPERLEKKPKRESGTPHDSAVSAIPFSAGGFPLWYRPTFVTGRAHACCRCDASTVVRKTREPSMLYRGNVWHHKQIAISLRDGWGPGIRSVGVVALLCRILRNLCEKTGETGSGFFTMRNAARRIATPFVDGWETSGRVPTESTSSNLCQSGVLR